ncbi:acyl-CoA thioesterase/BAAT N-terminal domain-containing protein, partial [Ralstonia pseudosolanacearum]|uniref:acyl-CoA thioesterase/BAAT N-terminal domain-containing protein n=1 Tax=Ralstonia pseudosolanacearum TaxID=1310165 RepID=UPI003CEC453A
MAASPAFALSVAPADDLIDVPRRIVVTGLVPGAQVDLAARTLRGHAVPWCSRAAFIADADGTVDLSRDAPVCGDSVVWKPSEKTPLTALACDALF